MSNRHGTMTMAGCIGLLCVLLAGCTPSETRWDITSEDLGIEISPTDEVRGDWSWYGDGTCAAHEEAALTWGSRANDFSTWQEFHTDSTNVLVAVIPFDNDGDWHHTAAGEPMPGVALVVERGELGDCDLEHPRGIQLGTLLSYTVDGDVTQEAVDADIDPSSESEPFGWNEHRRGPRVGTDDEGNEWKAKEGRVGFPDSHDYYASGRYAIIEGAYVAVHIVSDGPPDVTTVEVMDAVRKKIEADPPPEPTARAAG